MEDTIRTRALTYGRDHFKEVVAYVVAIASTVVSVSVGLGHRQASGEELTENVSKLLTKFDELNGNFIVMQRDNAVMGNEVHHVKEDVGELKEWKDKVTGVADNTHVPKVAGIVDPTRVKLIESHRAHKP